MRTTRVIMEARGLGTVCRVELDVRDNNWMDQNRNDADRRQGVIDAANGLLRALNLTEIKEADQ